MFLFRTFDLDMIYLWSVWYSLAEIVYLSAFRSMGSVVDFAVIRSRDGFAPSEPGVAIDSHFNHICVWTSTVNLLEVTRSSRAMHFAEVHAALHFPEDFPCSNIRARASTFWLTLFHHIQKVLKSIKFGI